MANKKEELLSNIEKQEESKISRRRFLKKTAYHAPVLIAMGQLVKPVDVHADSKVDGHPNDGWTP